MAPKPTNTPSSFRAWYVVAVLTLANVSGNVDRQIISLLVRPLKRDFGLTDTETSYLGGIAFGLFYTILGIPIARWADRVNRRNIIGTGVALWSVFTTLCAFAKSYATFFVARVGVGIGEATLQAPGVSLIADYFPRDRLGRAMSVYSIGNFFGSGLSYFIGAAIVSLVADGAAPWTLPLVGSIRAWQVVFLFVGLPGILIAGLFMTVHEPARRNVDQAGRYLPLSTLLRYIGANKRTYLSHGLGFAASATVNLGLAFWIPEFFSRTYGWTVADGARVEGILTMTIGVVGVLAGGRLADWFVARGKIDGPLRVGIIAAIGMLVTNTAFPLMPNARMAVVMLGFVNVFAALPWGAANAAAAEMAPTPLRAQAAALYFLLLSLSASMFGPTTVAVFTDQVYGEANMRYSLVTVNVIGMAMALILFAVGLRSYRRTVELRDQWDAAA